MYRSCYKYFIFGFRYINHSFITTFVKPNRKADAVINPSTELLVLRSTEIDSFFENHPEDVKQWLSKFPNIIYLQDELYEIYDLETDKSIKIYGSPWQPEFYSWAFNLPKNGIEISGKWEGIPDDTDILITHGPAWGSVDTVAGRPWDNLGCELLAERIQRFRPKIHVCGHIHSGYGIDTIDNIHYINASVLDEAYEYTQKPWNVEWDPESNVLFVK